MSDEQSSIIFYDWSLKDVENKNDKIPNINFHSLKYSDKCLYIWIGDYNTKMENLSCATKTPYEKDPIGIEIMLANEEQNNNTNSIGKDLSVKLSKKLNKQVFVSFNVSYDLLEQMSGLNNQADTDSNDDSTNMSLLQMIEKRLFVEIKLNQEKF